MYAWVAIALSLSAQQPVIEVDPLSVFYMADFHDPNMTTMLPIPRGRLSARSLDPPYEAVLTAEVTYVNGALALDPLRGVLYGNRCCSPGASIQAHDARTLELVATKAITLETSGSMTIELDPLRRVLFIFDGRDLVLTALSIEAATYGQKLATLSPPLLLGRGGASADSMAIDGTGGRLFITGTDGGPVLAIDISGIYPSGGSFGEVEVTAHSARMSNNVGGSLAIDEVGRRVFVIPANGTIRVFSADPPYRTLEDYTVERMSWSHCGLFFDGRNQTLYVGREVYLDHPERPIAIDKDGTQREIGPTPFDGDDFTIYGISFAGASGPFAERGNGAGPSEDPIGVRADRTGCACVRAEETSVLALGFLLAFAFALLQSRFGRD